MMNSVAIYNGLERFVLDLLLEIQPKLDFPIFLASANGKIQFHYAVGKAFGDQITLPKSYFS